MKWFIGIAMTLPFIGFLVLLGGWKFAAFILGGGTALLLFAWGLASLIWEKFK